MSHSFCLHPRWIIPIVPHGVVLEQHAIVIENGAIKAILDQQQARKSYPHFEHHILHKHALLPGFVNTHAHSAMSLLRGMADDLALMDWLEHHIWPAEKRHVSDMFVFDGTQHAMVEMLLGGTTTVNDMYFHHEAVARAGLSANMRTIIGCSILEFPTPYASNAKEYIEKALHAEAQFRGETLLRFALAPHAPYTVSDDTFKTVQTLAEQLDCKIHCHIHETAFEVEESLKQHGVRPLERIKSLGLLNSRLIAAHGVHLNAQEIEWLVQYDASVAHNPTSNLKLASGIAPIHALRTAGVNVGVGTDSAASNNKLDMLSETRLSALLPKIQAQCADAIPAPEALRMATLGGAKAVGLDHLIGSLEIGKRADMIAIDLSHPETQPCFNPISQIVYAADRQHITDVWVEGEHVVQSRHLTTLDINEIRLKTEWWFQKIHEENS